jgi:multidrug resistance efflux pump
MTKKLALLLVLAAIAIGTAAIAQQPDRVSKRNAFEGALVTTPSPLDIPRYRVGLIHEAQVPGQEAGRLVELNVVEGDRVKAGDLLAKIDDMQAKMQGRIAKAEHRAAAEKAESTVDVRYAEKASQVALAEWRKSEEANKRTKNAVSEVEVQRQWLTYERGVLEKERAESDRIIAGFTAEAKMVEIEAAAEAMKRREIRSPVDGIVVQVYLHKGEWVRPGDPVLHVVQLDRVKVEGGVEIAQFSPGQIVDRPVTIEATLQDRKVQFEGRITFVKPLLEGLGERYQVKAEVENRKENDNWLLFPGMYVDMTIHAK